MQWSGTVNCDDAAVGATPFLVPAAKKPGYKVGLEVWTVEVAPARGALAVRFHEGSQFVAINRSTCGHKMSLQSLQLPGSPLASIPVSRDQLAIVILNGYPNPNPNGKVVGVGSKV